MSAVVRERLLQAPGSHSCRGHSTCLDVVGNEGMEKNMETTVMRHIGTTTRIHFFIPS